MVGVFVSSFYDSFPHGRGSDGGTSGKRGVVQLPSFLFREGYWWTGTGPTRYYDVHRTLPSTPLEIDESTIKTKTGVIM